MKLNVKNLPITNLPYTDINLCKQMMLKIYEKNPFLAELPLLDKNDNILTKAFHNVPCINIKEKKYIISDSTDLDFEKAINNYDKIFNAADTSIPDTFAFYSPFFNLYLEMLKRIKPESTVVRLLGAYSFADIIFNQNTAKLISDKFYRKFITQVITLKALWYIKKIKEASPETKPLILFEEPYLYKFGTLKRINEELTNDTVSSLFSTIFSKLQKAGAYVGVQSFEKCNWQLVFEADANLISFDAYKNAGSLNIIAEKINTFLAKGGYINWGIIPVTNETLIRDLNYDKLNSRFIKATEELNAAGVSLDLIYKNCTISPQGNLSNLPILFAEKALILGSQLAKKIPTSSAK